MLHIINKSSFERNNLSSALQFVDDNSIVLLIEDGVICASKNVDSQLLNVLASSGRVYALKGDINARGLHSKLRENIKIVDYAGFVDLVVEYGTPVSWV